MNCGKCGNDYAALTTNGYCPRCDHEVTLELRQKKNKLLRTIYENNFDLALIAKITNRSVKDIKEFIKNNNLKKMPDNNYTCSGCGKSTNQLFSRFEQTGLCETCIAKLNKMKTNTTTIKEPINITTSINTKITKQDNKINEIPVNFVETLVELKNEDIAPITGKPSIKFKKPSKRK